MRHPPALGYIPNTLTYLAPWLTTTPLVRHSLPKMDMQPPPRRSQRLANPKAPALRPEPTLLTLPPELRLLIFEYVVTIGSIKIRATTKPPSLLGVNRQIRAESHQLWYTRNNFWFPIHDCNAVLVHRFHQRTAFVRFRAKANKLRFGQLGTPSWANLMAWCYNVHQCTTFSIELLGLDEGVAGNSPVSVIIAAAHEMSRVSQSRGEGWAVCEETLKGLRKAAVVADHRWLED